jgi:hypothetical protein
MHRAYQPSRGDATKFLDISRAPRGPFSLVLRIYWPEESVLCGPEFFDRLAVARLVFSTPMIARPFDDSSLGSHIQPFRFMLTASAQPLDASLLGVRTRYVAGYEKDPERWATLRWVNLYSHEPFAREARTLGLGTIGLASVRAQRFLSFDFARFAQDDKERFRRQRRGTFCICDRCRRDRVRCGRLSAARDAWVWQAIRHLC